MMVCLGNICRSPMAQGILESKIKAQSLSAVVDSAGTAAYHVGEPPDKRAISQTARKKIDISSYRGRHFQQSDFDEFDLIFAMDEQNYSDILALSRGAQDEKKVEMILNRVFPGQNMSVPDPYYGGEEGFENVFDLLDHACDKITEQLIYER